MNQITDDILKGASNTKARVVKTTAQLPIFRDSSNLLFLLTKRLYHVPGKMAKTLDFSRKETNIGKEQKYSTCSIMRGMCTSTSQIGER